MKKTKQKMFFNYLLGKPSKPFERFFDITKMREFPEDIPPELWPKEWIKIYYKSYQRLDKIFLPNPDSSFSEELSLKNALLMRRSVRNFSKDAVALDKMSSLLYYSAGLKNRKKTQVPHRFYPSPGGRYPLEVYILSLNTELSRGLYHYNLIDHSLEELLTFDKLNISKYFQQQWIKDAAFFIIISAVFKRNTIKYEDRGLRHILVEAGHMAQNFYLNSEALNLSCCAIGGYLDHELNKLIDIDGINESVVYVLAVGNQKSAKQTP